MRVRYSETDAQGIANNANYLSYFEIGRVEWLRAAGFSYKKLEDDGYGFVVVEAHLFYKKAARFDDELKIRIELTDLGHASLSFAYTLSRGLEVIATGSTRHGCVEVSTGRPVRVPAEYSALLR